MGERTQHAPGTFSWADLSTTDQEGAKAFYAGLLGWDFEDTPVGDGMVYSMAKVRGKSVGAISTQPEQQREAGVPPMWNNYVTVASADETARRAGELGATVHAPPFDVMDVGRMAVIQDPQGAFFMVWEPRASIGAELVNEPGALVWNELATSDLDAGAAFYRDLFGWETPEFEGAPETYLSIRNGGRSNGGMHPRVAPGAPPHWLPYFGVEDVDAAVANVGELGGGVIMGPVDIPQARIAMVTDPQGAMFALYAGAMED